MLDLAADYQDDVDLDALRWAKEHRRFLEENRPDLLAALKWSGDLDDYFTSIGQTASERLEHAMTEMLRMADKLSISDRVELKTALIRGRCSGDNARQAVARKQRAGVQQPQRT